MILDFRIRPPYKSFLDLGIVKGWQNVSSDPKAMRPTGFERRPVPSVEKSSLDLMIEEMTAAGVDKGVVMGRQTFTPVYGDTSNADVHELMTRYPERFIGFAGICPHNPNALQEVEHVVKNWSFKGIAMDPGWCTPPLHAHDVEIHPILDLCQQLGVAVSFAMSAYVGPDLSYTDPSSMIPIMRQYPKLKFVFAHACWPKVQEALGAALLCPNLYLAPDCYFYVRNMPFAQEFTKAANSYLKYRFLFASSYPIRGFEQCLENWRGMGLDNDALEYSLYANAADVLGL